MEGSDFSGPQQRSFPIAPGPLYGRTQELEPPIFPQGYPIHNPYSPYDAQGFHHHGGPRYQVPSSYGPSIDYYPPAPFNPFPAHGAQRGAANHVSPLPMFQHGPQVSGTSGLAPAPFRGRQHMPGSPHPELVPPRNTGELWSMMDPSAPGRPQDYSPQPYPPAVLPPPYFDSFAGRRPNLAVPGPVPPGLDRPRSERASSNEIGVPSRGMNTSNPGQPRRAISPGRRPSPHIASLDRRIQAQRRADRSVSPNRTSNRRSFDRYSTDLRESSSAQETEEALRARAHRARRQRLIPFSDMRARLQGTNDHPNVPTAQQMKILKAKLQRFSVTELPEGISSACDICQKDYSAEHVDPTEDSELAVQLPCKHVFGEHCINTWFETCKTHKNKVTCPMCRKLLVEPLPVRRSNIFASRSEMALLYAHSSPADRHLLERVFGGERFFEDAAARDLEGDFAHS